MTRDYAILFYPKRHCLSGIKLSHIQRLRKSTKQSAKKQSAKSKVQKTVTHNPICLKLHHWHCKICTERSDKESESKKKSQKTYGNENENENGQTRRGGRKNHLHKNSEVYPF